MSNCGNKRRDAYQYLGHGKAVSLFVPLSDDIECGPSAQRWITCMGPRTGLFHRITKTVYFGKKRKISLTGPRAASPVPVPLSSLCAVPDLQSSFAFIYSSLVIARRPVPCRPSSSAWDEIYALPLGVAVSFVRALYSFFSLRSSERPLWRCSKFSSRESFIIYLDLHLFCDSLNQSYTFSCKLPKKALFILCFRLIDQPLYTVQRRNTWLFLNNLRECCFFLIEWAPSNKVSDYFLRIALPAYTLPALYADRRLEFRRRCRARPQSTPILRINVIQSTLSRAPHPALTASTRLVPHVLGLSPASACFSPIHVSDQTGTRQGSLTSKLCYRLSSLLSFPQASKRLFGEPLSFNSNQKFVRSCSETLNKQQQSNLWGFALAARLCFRTK
ncbi:hypothetical protein VP01_994g2 [Puccinia sorghi]|uniref:Uncharacterized protein n=1 Tax=Puccinia sorghi TaxID=27349 RepID=A0A0L6U5B5_9BASI|nr:hypothetical protein VP01_994g2 [Puccinia sorghi]